MSIGQIAKALNRNADTISREIKRNSIEAGSVGRFKRYLPKAAQKKSEERRENIIVPAVIIPRGKGIHD